MSRNHLVAMVWFILFVWAGMIAADIFKPGYNPPIAVYGIPTIVVGALAWVIRHRPPED